ncbi:MAG: helix-turn-helix transcriptional regulator [Treponema sp.]|nr:helix-turn-helix transcriptional regulator [Treponema sp.]
MYSILNRIREVIIKSGISDNAFAKSIDVPQATFSNMFQRKSEPKPSWLRLISEKYKVSANWLLTGEGEMFTTPENTEVSKEQITNIPIIKNKIEKSQEIILSNQQIIDGHISLSAMFPVPKENLAAFIMNDNSMSGAGFLMQDILFIDTRSCELGDNAYLFVQNEKVYCRLFLFEEISNTVRICAMHTSDIRDVSVLEEIKIPEMESNYKIIGKVLAFLRKNNLF